ncbi:ATP-binding cassette subfamily B multidrug efflux pump [Breznakia sp. PF5-3]|uniref:ABC transporter ATP-binding protein n=1 Tax=unclassified Breznakia TaxID=2623764 RepID=UPI002406E867|nr:MULTISPECIES: ABC transporter transmembrane domain-containing protein [unclassified Breznakia]MDF9823674.1 ATP-binding cassette subfamily B multidrug efflux pump [Breznakia sp. PM6-1]MDF9834472.1 ATP-binding cassette subfamily B multidrug efflux pump [Breznakia sp. PF5-3]MDF9838479.1 ATP-binding cassette subfamily B multidrug efflux pump [Breznakia sp. PFB2-8]MDF9859134.1 ATP-binding cassette subfamily B multidrug efflux pump [Breznakia sp. PH5-24]
MKIFKHLSWFFKQEKKAYISGIFALFIIAVINLIPPKIMGDMIDEISSKSLTKESLIISIVILLVNAALIFVMRYVWRICIFGAAFRLERILRLRLFEHFTKMSASFFQKYRVGDLMAHATNDLKSIQRVAGAGVLQFADAVMTGCSVLFAMMFGIHFKLTLITLLPMPLMIIGSQLLSKRLHTTFTVAQQAFSSMNNRVHESITGVKVTKTFGQEKEEVEKFHDETMDVYKKNMKVVIYDAGFDPLIEVIVVLCYIFLFVFGAQFIQSGEITVGNLVTLVNYMNMLIWPMLAFGFLYNTIERGNVSYERIQNLLIIKPDIKDKENAIDEVPSGNIEFEVKKFTYDPKLKPVLQDIIFTLPQGETLGVVGKTGAGKTTLIKLLLREYDHYQGTIIFGSHEINDYKLNSYHAAIGYVPQDQFLFSSTIEDNIRFGNTHASHEDVIAAAKMAAVHDDIIGFSEGYDTVIGERGVSLSGGQKQRIAIARALILNPEVLILDDSLSAVDAKTEEMILEALKENRKGKTTIIVAHRFSAIKHSHLILVMDEGKIVERGIHDELITKDGWYGKIYDQQELYEGGEHHE